MTSGVIMEIEILFYKRLKELRTAITLCEYI